MCIMKILNQKKKKQMLNDQGSLIKGGKKRKEVYYRKSIVFGENIAIFYSLIFTLYIYIITPIYVCVKLYISRTNKLRKKLLVTKYSLLLNSVQI